MKRIETYLRLADLCDREAGSARDAGERRQFNVLSRAIRTWAKEVSDEKVPDAPRPTSNSRPSRTTP